jgi:TonB family protein
MSVQRPHSFRFLAGVAVASLIASAGPSLANPLLRAAFHPSYKGTVGMCVLVDPRGAVLDAKVVEPSGNPNLDNTVGEWARTLQVPMDANAGGATKVSATTPEWLPMYASFEGAPSKDGLPNCDGVRRQMASR